MLFLMLIPFRVQLSALSGVMKLAILSFQYVCYRMFSLRRRCLRCRIGPGGLKQQVSFNLVLKLEDEVDMPIVHLQLSPGGASDVLQISLQ